MAGGLKCFKGHLMECLESGLEVSWCQTVLIRVLKMMGKNKLINMGDNSMSSKNLKNTNAIRDFQ